MYILTLIFKHTGTLLLVFSSNKPSRENLCLAKALSGCPFIISSGVHMARAGNSFVSGSMWRHESSGSGSINTLPASLPHTARILQLQTNFREILQSWKRPVLRIYDNRHPYDIVKLQSLQRFILGFRKYAIKKCTNDK